MIHLFVNRFMGLLLVPILITFFAMGCGDKDKRRHDVIVVGAGLAGLSASLNLAQHGVNVLLLEKQDRVGGKLYSVEVGGIAANLGAQYLYSGGSPFMDSYLETLPIQILGNTGIVWNGVYIGAGPEEEMLDKLPISQQAKDDMYAAFEQLANDYNTIMQDRGFFTDLMPEKQLWKTLEGESCQDYLLAYRPEVYEYFNAELGGENAGDISTLSSLLMVGWYGSVSEIPRALVKGGNQVFAESVRDHFLAAGGTLRCNSDVAKIVDTGDFVKVTCRDGLEFLSDYAIVATPANVTKNIVPNISQSKLAALNATGYGAVAVVGLHIKGLPSGDEVSAMLFVGDSNVRGYMNQTGSILGNPDIGTVISAVVIDPETLQLDDAAFVQAVVESLKAINPDLDAEEDVLDYVIQRWRRGVVKIPPNFLSSYETALRESVGRIYFVGDYSGYDPALGGASTSGVRVSTSLLEARN